ncbi:MAG: hypothetical protein K2L12_08515, partial [Clostridia bacterium]|nr:hypothetical protein [Clostridia bacterium]
MKKTKLLAALAVAAVLAVGGGVLAGCKPTGGDDSGKGHTHNYTQWTKVDENTHRGTCDAKGDCDAKTKTEEHVYDGDNDTTCNKCDHVR